MKTETETTKHSDDLQDDLLLVIGLTDDHFSKPLLLPPLATTTAALSSGAASRSESPTTATNVSLETGCSSDSFADDDTSQEAVVSLFHCWRDEEADEENENHPEAPKAAAAAAALPPVVVPPPPPDTRKRDLSHLYKLSSDELLARLKKRLCRPEDLPPVPVLRRRERPVCHFLNFMGKTKKTRPNELGKPLPLPRQPASLSSDRDLVVVAGGAEEGAGLLDPCTKQQQIMRGAAFAFPKARYSSLGAVAAAAASPVTAAAPTEQRQQPQHGAASSPFHSDSGGGNDAPPAQQEPLLLQDDDDAAALWDFEPVGPLAEDPVVEMMGMMLM